MRPAVALVLIFAHAVSAFGFPIVQTRYTIKACGCVTPCGASTANCCCAKPAPQPEPKRARCSKCVERDEPVLASEPPRVKWVAGFQAKQCRGESVMGLLAEVPSVPPTSGESGLDFTIFLHDLSTSESALVSHVSAIQDPPPRRA